jgi:hypothetical protein
MNKIKTTNTNLHSFVFTKKINNKYKLIPFYTSYNQTGETRYLPPVAKEWKNHVYNYNTNNNINFPVYDLNINSLIKGYFNMYFNNKILKSRFIPQRKKRNLLRKIFVSKAEIKHTNNKAIITIYIYNKEKSILKRGLTKLKKYHKKFYLLWLKFLKSTKYSIMQNTQTTKFSEPFTIQNFFNTLWNLILADKNIYNLYFGDFNNVNSKKIRDKQLSSSDKVFLSKYTINKSKKFFYKIRKLRLKISLNKHKLENKFLFKLSGLISKYYNKKVEFNIVNLKSLASNNDIFTELLTQKLTKEQNNPLRIMNAFLSKVVLPDVNTFIEKGRIKKQVDYNLLYNKYINLNLSNIISSNISENSCASNQVSTPLLNSKLKDNFNNILYENFYKNPIIKYNKNILNKEFKYHTKPVILNITENETETYFEKIRKIVLSNIKYKNMGGVKFLVKGRLTRRYRADRALYKYKWKGGLKNMDSAYKGIPGAVFRGFLDSHIEKSLGSYKRRIGSFGVRSWLAGK